MADPFTPEQIEALEGMFSKNVNNAISARSTGFEKKVEKMLADKVGEITKSIEDKLAALKPLEQTNDDAGKNGKRKGEPDVEMQTVRKELGELRTQLENANKRAAEEEGKRRQMQLRSQVTEALQAVGISGTHARLALSVLMQEGRVSYGGDVGIEESADDLLFNDDTGAGWVKLDAGLKAWAKTPDAKVFMPPSGAGGGGTRPPVRRGDEPPAKLNPAEQRTALGNALKDLL